MELVEEVQGVCDEDFWERESESLWEDGEREKGKKREKRMEHGENAKMFFLKMLVGQRLGGSKCGI